MTVSTIPAWAEQLAVFDTETTGLSPYTARIVSATVALIDPTGSAVERYDWLIDPGVEIPERASQVHGITTDMARANGTNAGIAVQQLITSISDMLARGFPLVIYNAPYDLTILRNEAERHGLHYPETIEPVLDPLVIDKEIDRYRKGKRTLEVVASHYGVPLARAHDSGADAIAAGRVLQAIARSNAAELPEDALRLHATQIEWAQTQATSFENYMRRVKNPQFTADGRWPVR